MRGATFQSNTLYSLNTPVECARPAYRHAHEELHVGYEGPSRVGKNHCSKGNVCVPKSRYWEFQREVRIFILFLKNEPSMQVFCMHKQNLHMQTVILQWQVFGAGQSVIRSLNQPYGFPETYRQPGRAFVQWEKVTLRQCWAFIGSHRLHIKRKSAMVYIRKAPQSVIFVHHFIT